MMESTEYDRFMKITRDVMADSSRYPCTLQILNAWQLHAGLELARKHPGLHRPVKQELRLIAKRLQKAVVERHPTAAKAFGHAQAMDSAEWKALAMPAMADKEPITIPLSIRETWLIVSGLQRAIRHPHTPDIAGLTALGRQFQQQVATTHPDAWAILEMGWNPKNDVK